MPNLTEFLLARIAEDEQPTWTLAPYDCPPDCCAPAGWVGSQCRYCDRTPVYGGTVEAITRSAKEHAEDIHQRSRLLAECEAKRRIVALHHWIVNPNDNCSECGGYDLVTGLGAQGYRRRYPCETLRLLALPYADHPDFLPEWKP